MAPKTDNSKKVDAYRKRLKNRMIEAFGGKCGICAYDRCIAALEFHHLDPREKDFAFGRMWSRSWTKIENELMKCVLLCAICHREYHSGIIIIPIDIKRFDVSLVVTPHQYHKIVGTSKLLRHLEE